MAELEFDTVVIGSGTSAYYTITRLNEGGHKVAVVDERPYGGTCALRGCQPKKYLVANVEAVAMASHLNGQGLTAAPQTVWSELQALKNDFLDGISDGEVAEFENAGIKTFASRATLVAPDLVQAGEERLRARFIVVATGSTPRLTEIPGSEHVKDSEYFLNQAELPPRVVFIGGGYISFEFAHVTAHAGSQATILHRSAQPLKAFDKDMVDVVIEASKAAGISVVTNETPVRIDQDGEAFLVHGTSGETYPADLIIEATGRTPNLSVLDGDLGGVDHSPRGVTVNEYLQSPSNPQVYAIGDCCSSPFQLATVADEEGKVAAHNILNGNARSVDYADVPSAVFTIPNLASVGLSEQQARDKGVDFRMNSSSQIGWPSSRRIGEKHAGYKVLISNEDDTVLGAHLVRHNASEVINTFALAIKYGIKAAQLGEFLWAYPTYTSDLKYMVR